MMNNERLFPPIPAGEYLGGTKKATLDQWRSKGVGPAFIKIGGRIFYTKADLDAYIQERRVSSTAQARGLRRAG